MPAQLQAHQPCALVLPTGAGCNTLGEVANAHMGQTFPTVVVDSTGPTPVLPLDTSSPLHELFSESMENKTQTTFYLDAIFPVGTTHQQKLLVAVRFPGALPRYNHGGSSTASWQLKLTMYTSAQAERKVEEHIHPEVEPIVLVEMIFIFPTVNLQQG